MVLSDTEVAYIKGTAIQYLELFANDGFEYPATKESLFPYKDVVPVLYAALGRETIMTKEERNRPQEVGVDIDVKEGVVKFTATSKPELKR